MALIPLDLDTIVESKPVPVGKYDLTVASCEEVKSKKGKPQFDLSIAIEGHDDAPNMRHFMSLPMDGDTASAMNYKALLLKRFCHLFKVPLKGANIDTEALAASIVGARAKAEVGLDKETDAEGNEKPDGRVFNRLVVPFLPDEGGTKASGRVAPPPPKQ